MRVDMQKPDLHESFNNQITEFEKYLGFIDKAKAAADSFSAEVVEKVVSDNHARAMQLAGELMMPLVEVETHIDDLAVQRSTIETDTASASESLQELELRLMIGDLDDDTYATESAPIKATVDEAETRLLEIDEEHDAFAGVLDRWRIAGVRSGALEAEEE
jgi:hypothetical protein